MQDGADDIISESHKSLLGKGNEMKEKQKMYRANEGSARVHRNENSLRGKK